MEVEVSSVLAHLGQSQCQKGGHSWLHAPHYRLVTGQFASHTQESLGTKNSVQTKMDTSGIQCLCPTES